MGEFVDWRRFLANAEISEAAKLDNTESHAKVPIAQRNTTQVGGDATESPCDSTCDSISNEPKQLKPQNTQLNRRDKPNKDSRAKEETNNQRLDRIIKEAIPVEELLEPPRGNRSEDQNLPLMLLGYGELFTKVKIVYHSGFEPGKVTPVLCRGLLS